MSTNPSPKASGDDLNEWVAAALRARKATVHPRVGFEQLAEAARVDLRTAKRHINFERRGKTDPHISVVELLGYAHALRTTVDEILTEAIRLCDLNAGKDAQAAEAAATMTPEQHAQVREAQEKVKGHRARPRKQA